MQKTILLTGATGFLGSHLLESFIKQDFKVIILKRTSSDSWRINHLFDKVKIYDTDIDGFKKIFENEKIEIVINTVCNYERASESLIDVVNANLIFGLNLLDEAIKNNVKTFINTDSLLPRNLNNYSLSKAQLSDWLYKYSNQIQVINFKIEHMYGPRDDKKKFLPWLIGEMINGTNDINLTSGIQKRDFIYIDDVVDVYNIVIQKKLTLPKWNQFDVGTNLFTEVKEFVLTIANNLEKTTSKVIIARLKFGAISYRQGDIMIPELDNSKLLDLGWYPKITFNKGIINLLKTLK
ncbi:NAD-dependent epimerase/dehydratase family protein [Flavobacterium sp. DSR3-2]|uniref:NAD-dependent epimerase/dehydratase family protein n=1 Tax=Flavobacterium sp. DSR3-2 TaxID=2804634 RepID=UPI003CEFDE0F